MSVPVTEKTVKDYVVEDFRTAAVFEEFGLDFCCGGGQPLGEACVRQGVDPAVVAARLDAVRATPGTGGFDPAAWDADRLADHIVEKHHAYVRGALPSMGQHAEKVARVHGERHPEMVAVAEIVRALIDEMTMHMQKEEMILFPIVREMVGARRAGAPLPAFHCGSVQGPISVMEYEHDSAGNAMKEIRRLTAGYAPPLDACTTYRVLLQELEAFEKDLHEHVHLENNILFPKAQALENGLAG